MSTRRGPGLVGRLVLALASRFPTDELRSPDGQLYMRRHYLWVTRRRRHLRVHVIRRSDDLRALHDHPWSFWSLGISGGYLEHTPRGARLWRAPFLRRMRAEDLHALELPGGGWAVTVILTGPKIRDWGFVVDGTWVPAGEYADPMVCVPTRGRPPSSAA